MRTIKFRAWEHNLKEMIPVDDIQFYRGDIFEVDGLELKPKPRNEQLIMINTRSAWRIADDKDVTLVQFTGILDKNGKEIYEGDILSITTPSGRKCTSQVVWKQPLIQRDNLHPYEDLNGIVWWGGWGHKVIGDGSNYSLSEGLFEIIGNIYESKHLLDENLELLTTTNNE